MNRIPLFPDAGFTPEQRAVYDRMVAGPRGMVVGPMRAAIHSPELADRWQAIGEFLRYRSSLEPRISELAIAICGRYWNSDVEWYVHAALAQKAGISPEILAAIRSARPPTFARTDEALTYEYSRQLLASGQVDDAIYAAVCEALGVVGIVELTALVGYYCMVAMTLNVHRIPTPDPDAPTALTLDASVRREGSPTALPAAVRVSDAADAGSA